VTAPAADRAQAETGVQVALVALSLSVALGFGRVFSDSAWLAPVVATALGVHLVTWWCRAREWPNVVAFALSSFAVVALAGWMVLPEVTTFGLPGGPLLSAIGDQLLAARSAVREAVSPTPAVDGFVLATMIAVGLAVFMADWATFRIESTFEGAVPAFLVFAFTSALAGPQHRVAAVVGFVAGVLWFLVAQRAERRDRNGSWFGGRKGAGMSSLLRAGAVLGAVAVTAGVLLGPELPGAGRPAVIAYRSVDRPADANRETVSPLVDIRGRLVEHSGREVFTVLAAQPAYWRVTSLDTFNGEIWSSNDRYRSVDPGDRLRSAVDHRDGGEVLRQEYVVSTIESIWLPAAYRPVRFEGLQGVGWSEEAAALISDRPTADGLAYQVESAPVLPRPEELAAAPAQMPLEVAERYLELPALPPSVIDAARDVTRGAATRYDRARMLQDWLRTEFDYDLRFNPGHGVNALEHFLRVRRGYCEQFAGAYAVMARVVGLPAQIGRAHV
jgi:hypothetical protein